MQQRKSRRSSATSTAGHHNVYIVLLDAVINELRQVRRAGQFRP
jgi:hypothetical protein